MIELLASIKKWSFALSCHVCSGELFTTASVFKHVAFGPWQKLTGLMSCVQGSLYTSTSKCPCQISRKPLIMSLFFSFTATCSSILFSIRCIIFEVADRPVTVSKWFLTSSNGSLVKSLAFGQMLLSVPGQRSRKLWFGLHACMLLLW